MEKNGDRCAAWRLLLAEQFDDLLGWNRAASQNSPATTLSGQIDDSRGHIARRIAAIDDQWQAIAKLVANFVGVRALGRAVQVGRSGGDGLSEGAHNGERYFGGFKKLLTSAADIGSPTATGLSPQDVGRLRALYDR